MFKMKLIGKKCFVKIYVYSIRETVDMNLFYERAKAVKRLCVLVRMIYAKFTSV